MGKNKNGKLSSEHGQVIGYFAKGITKAKPNEDGKKISEVFTVRSAAEEFAKLAMNTGEYTHTWVTEKLAA